jgi:Glycine rich protein
LYSIRTVPTGVSKVFVNATGAQGDGDRDLAGLGGWVQASLSVIAGQTLYIFVGGAGISRRAGHPIGAGYNGGGGASFYSDGGGGGGSDIRTNKTNVMSRLIVAGGGGGGSYNSGTIGGNGGTKTGSLSMFSCSLIANTSDYEESLIYFVLAFFS